MEAGTQEQEAEALYSRGRGACMTGGKSSKDSVTHGASQGHNTIEAERGHTLERGPTEREEAGKIPEPGSASPRRFGCKCHPVVPGIGDGTQAYADMHRPAHRRRAAHLSQPNRPWCPVFPAGQESTSDSFAS
eukprot:scaffold16496_cov120-Isochrysis_galbana.AAC.7